LAGDGRLDIIDEVTETLMPAVHITMDIGAGLVWE
jgi:hypothetical protein